MSAVTLFIPGIPQPAGSKRAFPFRRANGRLGVRVTDDAKHGKGWRAVCVAEARKAYQGPPLEGPVEFLVVFTLPRPKTSKRAYPDVRPDTTKLVRALEDAMTGILWVDDAQITQQEAMKHYAHPGQPVGALLVVREIPGGQP
jgi:Holliday junction resolvase RusA-like endonuclease